MPELVLAFVATAAAGTVVARWWLVAVPLVGAVAWTGYAAVFGGVDRDGMPMWQVTLVVGGTAAVGVALALAAGVVFGLWLRGKRGDHPSQTLPQ